ncbi:hypothetical protein [Niastella populi]|uniref:Uncharacterized protein n=1 Tax=Niastella populi TaxID=550983 RepID=A0A1V9FK51_9BACT|nr:hypothetical protein [Niastella populi]OQP58725.1 hypothetical protein A4R26_22410 [Niastella populi]
MAVQSNFETALLIERYIIDADMQNYFGNINHQCLREFVDSRIKDGVIQKDDRQMAQSRRIG